MTLTREQKTNRLPTKFWSYYSNCLPLLWLNLVLIVQVINWFSTLIIQHISRIVEFISKRGPIDSVGVLICGLNSCSFLGSVQNALSVEGVDHAIWNTVLGVKRSGPLDGCSRHSSNFTMEMAYIFYMWNQWL